MKKNDLFYSANSFDELNVIIEIPAQEGRIKYEIKLSDNKPMVYVDRFCGTDMTYPCNYGFIPNTLAGDGDPIDILVITPIPLLVGAFIKVRPIGVLLMEDDGGMDEKIIAVPITKLTKMYDAVNTLEDLPNNIVERIIHFFQHYKDLEEGKWVKIIGTAGVMEAKQIIAVGFKNVTE